MHTLKVLAGGVLLLGLCLVIGRMLGSSPTVGLTRGMQAFIVLWFIIAATNLWFGVARAGYTLAEEATVFSYVFLGPVVVAMGLWWILTRSRG
jgi:small basic protein